MALCGSIKDAMGPNLFCGFGRKTNCIPDRATTAQAGCHLCPLADILDRHSPRKSTDKGAQSIGGNICYAKVRPLAQKGTREFSCERLSQFRIATSVRACANRELFYQCKGSTS